MTHLALAVFSALFFALGLVKSKVFDASRDILSCANTAALTMLSSNLEDEAKEQAIRSCAVDLLRIATSFFLRFTCVLVFAAIPLVLASILGLLGSTLATLASWQFIVIGTLISFLVFGAFPKERKNGTTSYSSLDKTLHAIAFSSKTLRDTMEGVETVIFRHSIASVRDPDPIFIASLPRAGTTILLEALSRSNRLASQTYRDMPFVRSPILWDRMSRRFRRADLERERAHGDGLAISADSVEAFEEVIWKDLYPKNYCQAPIPCWEDVDANDRVRNELLRQFKKTVFLRCNSEGRYLSKNNGNFARIPLLKQLFPAAPIIVPIRDPLEHATSMWHQHKRFLHLNAHDVFGTAYMRDLGHYEFGLNHRPFAFKGVESLQSLNVDTLDYWLQYWLIAFGALLPYVHQVRIVEIEKLAENPERLLVEIYNWVGLSDPHPEAIGLFRPLKPRADRSLFSPERVQSAKNLHALLTQSVAETGTGK